MQRTGFFHHGLRTATALGGCRLFLLSLLLSSHGFVNSADAATQAALGLPGKAVLQRALPPLLQPLSNNAVAVLRIAGHERLYSFFGLGAGRSDHDIVRNAYEYDPDAGRWYALPAVPGPGRLGSSAIGIGRHIYIFGGYIVNEGGSETTSAEVWQFDPLHKDYRPMPALPLAVDDSVVLNYRDRYAILISGWAQSGTTPAVQIFDSVTETWSKGSPFVGEPVFGHAAALVGDELVVCGGVKARVVGKNKYEYSMVNACYRAFLDSKKPQQMHWQPMTMHPGLPRYRAALVASVSDKRMLLVGGSTTAYNYNGIGYNGQPAQPEAEVLALDLTSASWSAYGALKVAAMDLRGAVSFNGGWVTVGGMEAGQKVSPAVRWFGLP